MADDLAALLARSARGDRSAFLQFYDATSASAHALALARGRSAGLTGAALQAAATGETRLRFLQAWCDAARQPVSGLSPLAWLLSLDLPDQRPELPAEATEAAPFSAEAICA